ELGQAVRLVGIGAAQGPHLMDDRRDAGLRQLPGGFGAGQSAADDVNGLEAHEGGDKPRRARMQRTTRRGKNNTRRGRIRRVSFWSTGYREEVKAGRIRRDLGGGKSRRNILDRLSVRTCKRRSENSYPS